VSDKTGRRLDLLALIRGLSRAPLAPAADRRDVGMYVLTGGLAIVVVRRS